VKFTCGDRVHSCWDVYRTGTVQSFCVADNSYLVKMDDGITRGYYGYDLKLVEEDTNNNKETDMPKNNKNQKLNKPVVNFQHGDQVMYTDSGIRGTVIGLSVTEKDTYIIELSNGTLETSDRNNIELVDFVREYDDGVKEGKKYADCIREEVLVDIRGFATDRSHDYAQGYLNSIIEGLSDFPDLVADILEDEEE
jgi:hypothetical protein